MCTIYNHNARAPNTSTQHTRTQFWQTAILGKCRLVRCAWSGANPAFLVVAEGGWYTKTRLLECRP